MRIEGYSLDEEKMNSPIKYDRDFLIELGNQPVSVFTVPESFLELAREPGSLSPTRHLGQPLEAPKGVIAPLYRGNSRGGGLGGSLSGGYNNNNVGGGFAFGALRVPPPPPSRQQHTPKQIIELKPREKLLEANPNAWKPNRIKARVPGGAKDEEPKSEEEIIIEGVVKDTRGILNKLTPENFDRLMEKFMVLPLDNQEGRVSAVISVLFEKAIDEPAFSAAYAKMVQTVCMKSAETSKIFRKQILDKCQREFQKSTTEEDKMKDIEVQIAADTTDADKKELLKLELEDLKLSVRKRSLGNVRFIGELYKLQMLTPRIMVECVRMLLATPDEENLECLCKLLTTVGQKLDEQMKELEAQKKTPEVKIMDKFFSNLDKLSSDKKISSRIRFAMMDLMELRQDHWKPRRATGGPKTIEEVHRDAYLQEIEEKRQINSLPPLSPDGPGGRNQNHSNTPIHHVPKKSDWTTVPNKAARFQPRKPDNKFGGQSFTPPTGNGPV